MKRLVLLLPLLLARAALADEATYVFVSEEDASTPPDASVCAAAPFTANVMLGASLYSTRSRERDGRVSTSHRRRIGRATACLELTNVLFPEGLVQRFYVRFDLPRGAYVAEGTCAVSSNAVPQPFIVLAGCTLKLVSGPTGSLGGLVTSSSVFNPLHQPGFATGSTWTLHEYLTAGTQPGRCERDDD